MKKKLGILLLSYFLIKKRRRRYDIDYIINLELRERRAEGVGGWLSSKILYAHTDAQNKIYIIE